MNARVLRHTSMIAFVVVGLLVSTAPAMAGQGKPEFRERDDHVHEEHKDEFLSEVCGIEIYVSSRHKSTFMAYADGSIVDHYNSTSVFTSPETGESLIRTEAATFRGQGDEVFDPENNTLTINFHDEFYGLPSKWSKPGEGTLLRDAGLAVFEGTVVLDFSDPAEPELISIDETITTKGPHPELEADVLGLICSALGA